MNNTKRNRVILELRGMTNFQHGFAKESIIKKGLKANRNVPYFNIFLFAFLSFQNLKQIEIKLRVKEKAIEDNSSI